MVSTGRRGRSQFPRTHAHTDVYNQSYFSAFTFPNNMPAIWDAHWGFLRDTQPRAVVVGEWGGFCKGKDAKWQRRLARYLRERGMTDNFCEWATVDGWSIDAHSLRHDI